MSIFVYPKSVKMLPMESIPREGTCINSQHSALSSAQYCCMKDSMSISMYPKSMNMLPMDLFLKRAPASIHSTVLCLLHGTAA